VLLDQCCVYNVIMCPDFNVSKFIASFLSCVGMDEADFCYQNYIMDILNGTIGWMLLHEFVSTQASIECSFR